MINECVPYYEGPYTQTLTFHAGYAITGCRFIGPLTSYQGTGPGLAADPLPTGDGGNLICPAAPVAGGEVAGVASWDVASGAKGGLLRGAGTVLPVESGGVIAVGDPITTDANGRAVVAATGNRIHGKAHSAAGAAGVLTAVELGAIPGRDVAP